MGNVNIKLCYLENLIIKKASDEAAAQAIEEIVDAAVEKAVTEAAEPKQGDRAASSQQGETLKVSSAEILANINKATVTGAQSGTPVLTKTQSNNGSGVVEGGSGGNNVNPRDGGDITEIPTDPEQFEAYWNAHKDDWYDETSGEVNEAAYDMLIQALGSFIEYAHSYQGTREEAIWRSRRVQLRNDKLHKEYDSMLDYLNAHPNDPNAYFKLRTIQGWEVEQWYAGTDNEDMLYIRQHLADFNNYNDDDGTKRLECLTALRSIFLTKIRANLLNLRDPRLQNPQVPSYWHALKQSLLLNLREFRRYASDFTDQINALMEAHPNLKPTINEPELNNNPTSLQDAYAALQEEYNHTHNQLNQTQLEVMLNKLIWYANQLGLPGEAAQWQNLLEQIGGRGNTTTLSGGGVGITTATSKITPDAVQTPSSTKETTSVNPNGNSSGISLTDGVGAVTTPEIDLDGDFATLTAGWDSFIARLTTAEPAAYNAKIAMLDAIINAAIAEEKGEETINIWRCRKYILMQNYTAALLGSYNSQYPDGIPGVVHYPLANLAKLGLNINGNELGFDTNGLPNPNIFSYINIQSPYAHCASQDILDAVNSLHGDLNMGGGWLSFLPNDDPQKEYLFDIAMIALHNARIQALRTRINQVKNDPNASQYVTQWQNWINTSTRIINKLRERINNFVSIYGFTQEQLAEFIDSMNIPGLTPTAPAQPAPPTFEEILAEGGEALQEFYDDLVAKYNHMVQSGEGAEEDLAEVIRMLYNAAVGLGDDEAAAHWRQIYTELFGDGGDKGASMPDGMGGKSVSNGEIPDRAGGIEGDDEELLVLQEKLELLINQYREEQEEAYQQDLLKMILNYVCIMAYERDADHSEYWLSRYKEFIAEWRNHNWGEFFTAEGVKKPENI